MEGWFSRQHEAESAEAGDPVARLRAAHPLQDVQRRGASRRLAKSRGAHGRGGVRGPRVLPRDRQRGAPRRLDAHPAAAAHSDSQDERSPLRGSRVHLLSLSLRSHVLRSEARTQIGAAQILSQDRTGLQDHAAVVTGSGEKRGAAERALRSSSLKRAELSRKDIRRQ